MRHTPTDWEVIREPAEWPGKPGRLVVVDQDTEHPQGRFVIATVNDSRGAESIYNADLIAAAPDLLDSLLAVLAVDGELTDQDDDRYLSDKDRAAFRTARAAIAKAKVTP